MINRIPKQGEIWWMNLSPAKGHEQKGVRPCYILTPEKYNRIGLCLICPITSKKKGYSGEVLLDEGLKVVGVVLTDHIRNVDWEQRAEGFVDVVSLDTKETIYERVNVLVSLYGE